MPMPKMLVSSLLAPSLLLASTAAGAKTPGATHCYNSICHRVLTLPETRAEIGNVTQVIASFYDIPQRDPHNPSTATSSGELFRADRADNAASPIYPDGTTLLLWNPASGMAAIVRVNNAGPYHPGRQLDVSRAVAERLGFASFRTAKLQVMVVEAPSVNDASYVRGRRYAALPGVIGRFAGIEDAAQSISDETPGAAAGNAPLPTVATVARTVAKPSLTTRILARAPAPRSPKPVIVRTATRSPERTVRPKPTASWTSKFYD